jgi:hypothetical protein
VVEYHDWRGAVRGERRGAVYFMHASGIVGEAAARTLCSGADTLIEEGESVFIIGDWSEMVSFDTAFRTTMTAWVVKNTKKTKSIHILVKSAIVNVGVNMAAIPLAAVGIKLTSTTDREAFDARLKALAGEEVGR